MKILKRNKKYPLWRKTSIVFLSILLVLSFVNWNSSSFLINSIKKDQLLLAKFLILMGVSKELPVTFPYATDENIKVFPFLLENGADPNVKIGDWNHTPLHKAVKDVYQSEPDKVYKLVKILIEHGADVNARDVVGLTPLHTTIEYTRHYTDLRIIKLLVNNGAKIDVLTHRSKESPFYYSLRYNYPVLAKYLIEAGMDLNLKSRGYTPLHFALYYNQEHITKLLIEKGADLSLTEDEYNKTHLHFAVDKSDVDLVALLLKKGADPNQQDIDGNTALHQVTLRYSEDNDLVEILRTLLAYKSDPYIRNNRGETPLNITQRPPADLSSDISRSVGNTGLSIKELPRIVALLKIHMKRKTARKIAFTSSNIINPHLQNPNVITNKITYYLAIDPKLNIAIEPSPYCNYQKQLLECTTQFLNDPTRYASATSSLIKSSGFKRSSDFYKNKQWKACYDFFWSAPNTEDNKDYRKDILDYIQKNGKFVNTLNRYVEQKRAGAYCREKYGKSHMCYRKALSNKITMACNRP